MGKGFCFIGLTLVLSAFSFAHSQNYKITDLGTLGGSRSEAYGINNHGHVVGQSQLAGDATFGNAFLWHDGMMMDLGVMEEGQPSAAIDINDNGVACGWAITYYGHSHYHAMTWHHGSMHMLHNAHGRAASINNQGHVVYNWVQDEFNDALLWVSHAITPIPSLFGSTYTNVEEINNSGQVVGTSGHDGSRRAFLFKNGATSDLGVLPGGTVSAATAINDLGQVAGYSNSGIDGKYRMFLWQNDAMRDLGIFNQSSITIPTAINKFGQIVGWASSSNGTQAFFWQNEKYQSLSSLVRLNSGWTFEKAMDINDNGQIVGFGKKNGFTRAFLLTPLPPGDTNEDGCVNDFDLANVILDFGHAPSGDQGDSDITNDGIVDDFDLAQVIFNFGQGFGQGC